MTFAHINLIARNWRALAAFYESVFDCVPVAPERDISGAWLDKATGVEQARIRGMHLRLPGYGETGPTLEIFSYDDMPKRSAVLANTPGFTHIAFAVDDVAGYVDKVVNHGGSTVGALTKRCISGAGDIVFQYVADPEGNIIELQSWSKL